MTGHTAKPKAGDTLVLMDGKTCVLTSKNLPRIVVVLSRMLKPIPVAKLALVPSAWGQLKQFLPFPDC